MNVAPFGHLSVVDLADSQRKEPLSALSATEAAQITLDAGKALQVEWTQLRDVRTVELQFKGSAPSADDINLAWWRRIWPDNGTGGWMKLDDPFNGQWTRAKVSAISRESTLRLQLAPLDEKEAPGIKREGMEYRHTYKIRISTTQPAVIERMAVFTGAIEKRAKLRFEWDQRATVRRGQWPPPFEARNGRIVQVTPSESSSALVDVEYADASHRLSADRGHVICRRGETSSFAVFIDDVLREGGLYVRDLGVFVSDAAQNLTHAKWPGPPGEVWKEGTIAEQVAKRPEQSFDQVKKAIPLKPPNYLILGVPHLRQEIALSPSGDVILQEESLRSPGPDTDRRPWKWNDLTYRFDSGAIPFRDGRSHREVIISLEEGWLPIARHEWETDDIHYTQTSVASTLLGDMASLNTTTGTETVVLSSRFDIKNKSGEPRTAYLWMELNHLWPGQLEADGTLVLQSPSDGQKRNEMTAVRGRFNIHGKGRIDYVRQAARAADRSQSATANPPPERELIRYQIALGPQESHAIELAVPYIELLDARELAALKSVSFEELHASVMAFWKRRVTQGMSYEVPDQFLNEFFKANLWHVLISTDIDPVTGQYQHGAATFHYKNFLNETMMVARSLEMRGEHEEALRLIETFLANQSVKGLPGNFKSKEGILYAAHPVDPDPYTAQGYNMHHGWAMWGAAEHFFWTKDKAYLQRHADQLVKACDWITRERQATKFTNSDGTRPVEYGLAPAGDLEDVEEYLYFYATDSYYYLGLKQVAAALARIGHPEAKRLQKDAEEFLANLRASVAESVASSPVVRLKDGIYVPFVPPRAYALTHRKEGWIREGLYPALHLLNGEVYPATHLFADWMIQDLEDNIFLSQESGYGVENQQSRFFDLGGFTLQPNLLDLAMVYLKRDQVPNFLRAFYNTAWASLYPETMCFAEWVPALGKGGGPLYKTPDECKFIQWMRCMLIVEQEDRLELGLGVPRAWMGDGQRIKIERAATFFGLLNMEIKSQVGSGQMRALVHLEKREAPRQILLRLRHPAGKVIRSALVNGQTAQVDDARQLVVLPAQFEQWEVVASF